MVPTVDAFAPLDSPTGALVALAAAIGTGEPDRIGAACADAVGAGVAGAWADELLLQSVLMVGYPRALVAAGIWREVSGVAAPGADVSEKESPADWVARGAATCARVYGENYEQLRRNVRTLHPALDRWMIAEGYGRVLSRPGLDLKRRELCTVAQIAVLEAPRQLHSHLRGALHAGATVAEVNAALRIAGPFLTAEASGVAARVWAAMRPGGPA